MITDAQKFEAAQTQYGGKVKTFARNSAYAMPGYTVEDVEQELLVVLWECALNYDPNKGATFNTYFQRSAKNRVITLIRHFSTKGRTADVTSLDDEAVASAIEEVFLGKSAEDQCLLQMDVDEALRLNPGALSDGRGRRRRVAIAA